MDSQNCLRVRTLSPVRSPVSADSERRAAESIRAESTNRKCPQLLPDNEALEKFDWPWRNGYGTLDCDNLPVFFQPFECYSIKVGIDDISSGLGEILDSFYGEIDKCALYLYDDTVSLLQLDVVFYDSGNNVGHLFENDRLDDALSESAKLVYQRIVYPAYKKYFLSFGGGSLKSSRLESYGFKDPKKLSIFRDVVFDLECPPDSYVLWTGRYIVAPPAVLESELGESLCRWVSYQGAIKDFLEGSQFVSSGNIISFSEDQDRSGDNWLRGLLICQYYNSILYIYSGILKSSYSQLDECLGLLNKKKRSIGVLMEDITCSLDHLEFTRLEFNEALVGVQSERAVVVSKACEAWKMEQLIASSLERTDLIRSRISRLVEARKHSLNRSVELILSIIGGVSLVDLVLSLSTASRDLDDDGIPGLLDIFGWLQPDTSILFSTLTLLAVSAYIYIAKR